MQFSTQIHSGSSPFKPDINPSHAINMAQHGSKIKLKTISQRLKVNQSRKNPYLLKRRPSSNLLTLLLGPRSSDRRNADFLFSLFLSPFILLPSLFLSSFSFISLPFILLFLFFLSFLFFPFCSQIVVISPYLYILQTPSMLPRVTHMACHV